MIKREVGSNLESMLVNNEPLRYAHLIKFERPSKPDLLTGKVSTSAQRFTYLTDASRDIKFDDSSVDLLGRSNGVQTYLANKVISVGSIQEQTKATASTTSVVLDGTSIGAYYTFDSTTVSDAGTSADGRQLWDVSVDPQKILDVGFREGDKVLFNGVKANIHSFTSTALKLKAIDYDIIEGSYTNVQLELASEEIISILLDKTTDEYSSFVNREVYIYRAYFDQSGNMVDQNPSTYKEGPVLLFKGIITSVSFDDNDQNIKVSWTLTSHWGDFAQVKGRITSDSFHRALDDQGIPQPDSAAKREYAYDLGFNHAESSINMLATYTVQVEKVGTHYSKGVLGIGSSFKSWTYMVPEDRQTTLDLSLNAKSIPVVYGVRVIEGIPVFADTRANDSADVYLAVVLSEGEIGGVYDMYIEGNSLICNDSGDYDARSVETYNTAVDNSSISLVCSGRADRGDTLGGGTGVQNASYNYNLRAQGMLGLLTGVGTVDVTSSTPYAPPNGWKVNGYTYSPSMNLNFNDSGLLDGDSITLEVPQYIVTDIFSGKPGQAASAQLTNIAYAGLVNPSNGFKIQQSYWNRPDTYDYWGPNHRLLDTAYVVHRVKISEGETTIPDIRYVVRGKVLECYNYDYSYSHYNKAIGESPDNFALGSTISLYASGTNSPINAVNTSSNSYQIIDKWSFYNPDGTVSHRFRFDKVPNLVFDTNDVPSITKFYMKNSNNFTWTMVSYNHNEYYSATCGGPIYSTISGINTTGALSALIDVGDLDYSDLNTIYADNATDFLNITYSSSTDMNAVPNNLAAFQITTSNPAISTVFGVATILANRIKNMLLQGASTNTTLTTGINSTYNPSLVSDMYSYAIGNYVVALNCIKLASDPSGGVDDYLKNHIIEVTRYDTVTGKVEVQKAEIIRYLASSRIVVIEGMWEFIPVNTDSVRIYQKYIDSRVSTNTAIQTLDYVTSQTYGKGLDVYRDLDLPSWLDTARKCDTRSNVTVKFSSNVMSIPVGRKYYYSNGGSYWQGEVYRVHDDNYIEFTNCIGKLTNKWFSWKEYAVGDIVYNSGYDLFVVTTAGVFNTEPTTSTHPNMSVISSITLSSSSGSLTTVSSNEGNPIQSIRNGSKISGYSVYDADDINYWRHTGWDGHAQRYVTKYQSSGVIDTATPLFDNLNSLLDHFNGIMRYSSGKYYLDLEEKQSDSIDLDDIRTITVDDIVGSIKLSDEGVRSAFNSLTAAFSDPANKFEARSISFFNSDYLKIDRNVPKKGNLSLPAITNYYNTRLLADGFLNRSRYGLVLNLTMRTHGILLLAGSVIQVIYDRYGWDSPGKKFRITNINHQADGLSDITAVEYDDSFYEALSQSRGGNANTSITLPAVVERPATEKPGSLQASTDRYNQIRLTWDPGPNASQSSYTEIWRSDYSNFTDATIVAVIPNTNNSINEYIDVIPPELTGDSGVTKYYKIRRRIIT